MHVHNQFIRKIWPFHRSDLKEESSDRDDVNETGLSCDNGAAGDIIDGNVDN